MSSLRILRKHIKRRFNCFKNQGTQTLNCILVSSFVNCVGYSEQFTPSSERPGRPEALAGTTVFVLSTGKTVTVSRHRHTELGWTTRTCGCSESIASRRKVFRNTISRPGPGRPGLGPAEPRQCCPECVSPARLPMPLTGGREGGREGLGGRDSE